VTSSSSTPSNRNSSPDESAPVFKDAEAWLAERGIARDPIDLTVLPESEQVPGPGAGGPSAPARTGAVEGPSFAHESSVHEVGDGTDRISARDARRLAGQAAADAQLHQDEAALPASGSGGLEDDVAEAMTFVRASTSAAPQAEGRVRSKLADRGWSPAVIDATLDRARRERLVDDAAMAAALVAERRAKGHAVARIRRDLRERGFGDAVLTVALGDVEREDPEAAAFAVARDKAAGLTGLTAETAFRRVVGHVTRRGYPEGIARKVAREAVFTAREAERIAGR
jgi:SOS response regulatory protein OraA/RecX